MSLSSRSFWPAAILAGLACAASAARAEPPPTAVSGVEVEGRLPKATLPDRVHAFVDAVAVHQEGQSLMRWREPVCPLVAGLPAAQGEFILARVSQVAAAAGARLAPQQCRPNFYVVVTRQPEALLKVWRRRDANLFGQQPKVAVGRFVGTDRPVRVWHNWDYRPYDGTSMSRDQGDYLGAWALWHADDSRQITNAIRAAWGAVVVVDAGKIDGLTVGQLADYIAMTGLAEVNPDAGTAAAPTILRLFDTPPAQAPVGLSAWDQAYLKALYGTDQAVLKQRNQIANRMLTVFDRAER